ncbi:hypothetical protein [Streptomyces sp. NPDC048191]|uniref:hypothetical protein n=1 Tax=Streptomyces sp. NPDC048191 TaxID=3155484 RepID=UPI0033D8D8F1
MTTPTLLPRTGLQARLATRPARGLPAPGDIRITEVSAPAPAPGQVLARHRFPPCVTTRSEALTRMRTRDAPARRMPWLAAC